MQILFKEQVILSISESAGLSVRWH